MAVERLLAFQDAPNIFHKSSDVALLPTMGVASSVGTLPSKVLYMREYEWLTNGKDGCTIGYGFFGFLGDRWWEEMKRIPKLTKRQRAFLDKLLELYQEHKGPVHYSEVAKRLGVNRFSAYDMLKVLEKKGFAASSYALAAGHSGPGRSMVVFAPTSQAALMLGLGMEDSWLGEDWQKVREYVLRKLQSAREASARDALSDLLARLPEAHAPLAFCTQMIGALLLNMQRARARAEGLNPFRALAALRTADAAELETLAGLSVGATLSADDENGRSLTQRLLDQVQQYQTNLSRLSGDARSALVQFLEEALEALD